MMSSLLLPVHLAFVGAWLGCIFTEIFFERALLGKGQGHELTLAELHKKVDIYIEIPAFAMVLTTGALMLSMVDASTMLYAKVVVGLIAVAANSYCAHLVFQRARAAQTERWDDFARLDDLQHKYGAVVLLACLIALLMGLYLYVAG